MKFGNALATLLPHGSAWRPHSIEYKRLKRLLKPCAGLAPEQKLRSPHRADASPPCRSDASLRASPAEQVFFSALRDEIHKVNRFVIVEQRQCAKRLQLLESDLPRAIASGDTEWLCRVGQLYDALQTLEWFCVLNFCAVSKILKKHDKWTAYATRTRFERAVLVKQPFATYVPLLQMMQRVEAMVMAAIAYPTSAVVLSRDHLKLPPLRIDIGAEMDEVMMTDSEDMTPRSEADDRQWLD